jgi:hypothetical protein
MEKRTPLSRYSRRRHSVSPTTPCFVAEYTALPGCGTRPAADATLTRCPLYGARLWVRYAHENPTMGRFAVRFGLSEESLRAWMTGPPMDDISAGVAAGRYAISPSSVESVASLVLGATVSAMWMVLEGHQTWREAGSSTAELLLRALGIDPAEAHEICTAELPRLT